MELPLKDKIKSSKADTGKGRVSSSQWALIWRGFRRHGLAKVGSVVLVILYVIVCFADFFTPYDANERFSKYTYHQPMRVHFLNEDGLQRPFVYGVKRGRDPVSFEMVYQADKSVQYPVRFFVRGKPYKLLGIWETNIRLFGTDDGQIFLFGTDRLGRDVFSRTLQGAKLSLTIGLVGVSISLVLGIIIGGISGYYGGTIDNIIQRVIEFLMSIPSIPLWMALAAAVPVDWPIVRVYFSITIILSVLGWTGLARVVRGRILALREADFVLAARGFGASDQRLIFKHLLPNVMSYVLVNATLAIPGMILGETSLSFLGLGLRPPAVSWGVLLQDAQNVQSVANYPWMLIPALFVVVAVLAFNFVGDGLRDAADPYGRL